MTAQKRQLSPEISALLVSGIEFHVRAASCCNGQAEECHEAEANATEAVTRYGIARIRATHELEAAVHTSALTSIGLTLAHLDAQGFEVRGLVSVRLDAELREKHRHEKDEDDTGGSKPS